MSGMEPVNTDENRNADGTFKEGFSGNPNGRPPGSLSAMGRLKQLYAANPQKFDDFVLRYADNEANDRHQVEMLDGKPMQSTDITTKGEAITPLLVKFIEHAPGNGNTN